MNKYIEMEYIEVKQPIGSFYIGKLKWNDILEIAHADIRRIQDESAKNDSFDSLLGIQRELSPTRIKEISEYVRTQDATFPTSVILSIRSTSIERESEEEFGYNNDDLENAKEVENVIFDEENGILRIRKIKNIASILDGQHRIEGLREGFSEYLFTEAFEFNVTLFIDMDIDDQAQVFSVINKAQTKVNKSLVYDLYEFAQCNSPQKTAHDVVRLLNKNENSPFFKKVKILGVAHDKDKETIAQATFAELILDYISKNPMQDRDRIRRKKNAPIKKVGLEINPDDDSRRIFRKYFIEEKNEIIVNILWEYFDAIRERWPNAWDNQVSGSIISKSTGIIAFMRLLKDVYLHFDMNWNKKKSDYIELFNMSTLTDNDFVKEKFIPGTSGQSKLYKLLLSECIEEKI